MLSPVDDNPVSSLTVDDRAGSLTVDAPVGTPVFVRLSDGTSAVPILPDRCATATPTNVPDTTSSTTIAASNPSRLGLTVFNDSSAALLLHFGATTSATAFVAKVPADSYYVMDSPIYTGAVNGIWLADGGGAASPN